MGMESHFENAVSAIIEGDAATLSRLLADHPDLISMRSASPHRSTLLHYVSANGVEDVFQKTPPNILAITEILLDAGADIHAESEAYGGGCTVLGLTATSEHPRLAGLQIPLLQLLLARGARFDASPNAGNGHTIVQACLANGQPEAADFFVAQGAALDAASAAALGKTTQLAALFEAAPPEQREQALIGAAWYGQVASISFLLDHGVAIGTTDSDGKTALHCSAYGAHMAAIELLLSRGADVAAEDLHHQATPLDVALWTWRNSRDAAKREHCYAVVSLLLHAGARPRPHWHAEAKDDQRMRALLESTS